MNYKEFKVKIDWYKETGSINSLNKLKSLIESNDDLEPEEKERLMLMIDKYITKLRQKREERPQTKRSRGMRR